MATVILEASYSGANLAAPAVIPIDIPLPAGTVTGIDVAVKSDMDGGDATFNFYLNSLTPLATGLDRWIIPDGDKIFSKTGLSLISERGDYLELRLEDITGGAIAFEPIMIYVTYEDETNFDDVYVSLTEDQNVDGVKTFLDSPLVPDPTTALQATSKAYVDFAVASVTGNQPSISALVSGGIVSWVSALTFQVSAAVYYIQGVLYEAASQQVTLDAADATNDRIDVLALDTSGDFVKITGTPASEPNEPDYDPATQLKLTFVIIPALATEPADVLSDDIYLENTEWTSATSGSGFNAASTNNPFAGTKDIEGTNVTNNSYVQLTRSSSINIDDYNVLAFYIRSKAAWGANRFLRFQFFLSGVSKSSSVTLKTGFWGFDDSNTSSYQFVAIPLAQFLIDPGTMIDRLRIVGVGSGGSFGFYIDDISLRNSGTPGTTTQGITQDQADVRYLQQLISTYSSKTTPINADSAFTYDSVNSIWKVTTWTDLKAFLKTYFDTLYAAAGGGSETATTLGALINGAGAATPNNGDFVATAESGGLLKKITWTNVKAFLKTYFDTLYIGASSADTLSAKKYSLTAAHGSDDTYEGQQIPGLNNSGGVTQWDAVYLNSSSQWVIADANGSGTYPARGLAVSTETNGNPVTVLVRGTVRNDAWNWTVGGTIYLSGTAGGLTQTAPSTSGDKVQAVGYALTADIAFFDFNSTYLTIA